MIYKLHVCLKMLSHAADRVDFNMCFKILNKTQKYMKKKISKTFNSKQITQIYSKKIFIKILRCKK